MLLSVVNRQYSAESGSISTGRSGVLDYFGELFFKDIASNNLCLCSDITAQCN